jgi:hypothetical protein
MKTRKEGNDSKSGTTGAISRVSFTCRNAVDGKAMIVPALAEPIQPACDDGYPAPEQAALAS